MIELEKLKELESNSPQIHELIYMWLEENSNSTLGQMIIWPRNGHLIFISCKSNHDLVMLSVDDDIIDPGLYVREEKDKSLWCLHSKFNEFSTEWFELILATIKSEKKRRGCEGCNV